MKEKLTKQVEVQPKNSQSFFRFNKKFLLIIFFVILGLILIVGFSFATHYYMKSNKVVSKASNPSVVVRQAVSAKQALHSSPVFLDGSIQWNPNVEEVSQTPALSLVRDLVLTSRAFGDSKPNIASIRYYNVGTWLTGEYKGKNIIDAVVSVLSAGVDTSDTITVEYIVMIMEDGDKLVLFDKSSSFEIADFHDDSSHKVPEGIIVDQRILPDLFYSYPVYTKAANGGDEDILFPVTYLGKIKKFAFWNPAQYEAEFNTGIKPGYKLFSTFPHGQKLYGKDPSLNPVPWSSIIGTPYYVEDVDHSIDAINSNIFSSDQFSKNITWIKQPDLLSDLAGYHQQYDPMPKSANDINYSDGGFVEGCTDISIDKMAGDSKFDSSQLELVATSDTHQIYRPTNVNNLLYFMYDYISKNVPTLTFERYSASFPLLVYKDTFGTYQLMVRMDYPGHPQGCGKPVIYLYPTQKTNIKVSFSSPMSLTKTEPLYNSGWNVTAYPDGKLINNSDNKQYPYLYWEGFTRNEFPELSYGNVVKKEDIKDFLSNQLDEYGLNKKESKDFMDYWMLYLSEKPYYLISFYTTQDLDKTIPEFISPKPNSVLRILMKYQGLDKPIVVNSPPKSTPFQRNGFTVVEWGGIYED